MPTTQRQSKTGGSSSILPQDVRAIVKDAFVYGFPLVDSYRIQYSYFIDKNDKEYKGHWNTVINTARVYTPEDKAIQTPNSDTPYSYIGADLRAEPLVLSFPEIESGRYYSAQFIDMYTFNFAYVGSRVTGNGSRKVLLAGPGWSGGRPDGISEIIRCETDYAFVLYRTQLFHPHDIENVKKVQGGFAVQPLSQYLGKTAPAAQPTPDFIKPINAKTDKDPAAFFNNLNFILQFCPTHASEVELMKRFGIINIGGGKHFDIDSGSPDMKKAVADGIEDALRIYQDLRKLAAAHKISSADVLGSRDFLKNKYSFRMLAAADGIYGNSKEEAIYPVYIVDSAGKALDGSTGNYVLRFDADKLPPVNAFWSLTLYEMPASLLYANKINRYLINSAMLPDLKKDADGGITFYIQHESPGTDKESNWLPAPQGPFICVLRLYWPKMEVINGTWQPPPLKQQ